MDIRKFINEFSQAAPAFLGIFISLLTALGLLFGLVATDGSSGPRQAPGHVATPPSGASPKTTATTTSTSLQQPTDSRESPTPVVSQAETNHVVTAPAQPTTSEPDREIPPEGPEASPSSPDSKVDTPSAAQEPKPLLPVSAWTAPEPRMLEIPTHEGSGQGTHPSVLYFADGWHGYKYWMAFTPYPKNSNFEEDPNVVVSNDGDHWVVPPGLTNPIDDAPGDKEGYNSDTNLAFYNGRMYLSWRRVTPQQSNEFYLVTSEDGVHWSDKELIFNQGAVSQALVRVGEKWRMYAIQGLRAKENVLVYWESELDVPSPDSWSEKVTCNLTQLGPVYEPWHVDVQRVGDEWLGLLDDTEFDRNGVRGRVHMMRSEDGVNWDVAPQPLFPASGKNYNAHYKSGFVAFGAGNGLELDVFAAFLDTNTRDWHIGRTTARASQGD